MSHHWVWGQPSESGAWGKCQPCPGWRIFLGPGVCGRGLWLLVLLPVPITGISWKTLLQGSKLLYIWNSQRFMVSWKYISPQNLIGLWSICLQSIPWLCWWPQLTFCWLWFLSLFHYTDSVLCLFGNMSI